VLSNNTAGCGKPMRESGLFHRRTFPFIVGALVNRYSSITLPPPPIRCWNHRVGVVLRCKICDAKDLWP
jgi:hypothetical protein